MTDILQHAPSADRKAPPPAPISFEEFLAWADEDTRAEWVDGEVVPMSPDNVDHLRIVQFLYDLVGSFVRQRQLGEVFMTRLLMRLATRPSGREPDLSFVSAAHAERIKATYLDGPADLVVEVASPESAARDRGEKFLEYEAAGVPEYWLVDPLREEAGFYRLGPDGRYRLAPLDADGWCYSAVLPGFRLRPDWL